MFLGEYFKGVIFYTEKVKDNIEKKTPNSSMEQEEFLITQDIMNSIGTACKQYVEAPRQQLRISIALARNPEFENEL